MYGENSQGETGNLVQAGLLSSNATFSYLRAGAKCTRTIWGANGSYQIFSNGMELDLFVVSHENTVEFAALTKIYRCLRFFEVPTIQC
jgi:hypothetical protein